MNTSNCVLLTFCSDSTLTVENVTKVMGEVKDWKWVVVGLGVPPSKQDKIEGQSSTDGEKGRVLGAYWVNTDPDASWKKLARVLYWNREERAISITKQYLPKGTLSLSNPELDLYH